MLEYAGSASAARNTRSSSVCSTYSCTPGGAARVAASYACTLARAAADERATGVPASGGRGVLTQRQAAQDAPPAQCRIPRLAGLAGLRMSLVGVTSTDSWKLRSSPGNIAPTPTTWRVISLPSMTIRSS